MITCLVNICYGVNEETKLMTTSDIKTKKFVKTWLFAYQLKANSPGSTKVAKNSIVGLIMSS